MKIKHPRTPCPHCGALYVPPVTLICDHCGKQFQRKPFDIDKHDRKLGSDAPHYCCRDCAVAGRVGKRCQKAAVPETENVEDWNRYLGDIGLGVHAGTRGGMEVTGHEWGIQD